MLIPLKLKLHGSSELYDHFSQEEYRHRDTSRAKFAPSAIQLVDLHTIGDIQTEHGESFQYGKLREGVEVTFPDSSDGSYLNIPADSEVTIELNHDGSPKYISIDPDQHRQLDWVHPPSQQQHGGKRRRAHRRRTHRHRVHRHRRRTHRRRHH